MRTAQTGDGHSRQIGRGDAVDPTNTKRGDYSVRTVSALVVSALAVSLLGAGKPHDAITGKVVAIADGDTLTVLDDAKVQHWIWLAGIDAPERKQAFGTKAREALAAKVFGKAVRVELIDTDRNKRKVGRLYLGDRFINLELVQDGFAWRYPPGDKAGEFIAAQRDAREHRRGLWADADPEAPWEFRRWRRGASGRPLAPLPK
jgi:endonuclease YncB( thermonuclease family)